MPRKANLEDIRSSIDAVLANLARQQGRLTIPIDLAEVCRNIGVEWELRWMIPEGVTAVVDDGLKIFIRNNFPDEQVGEKRQRFTWAHEICHALLYDRSSKPPQPVEDAPKGAALESLCQNGAGYLLMPATEMKRLFNVARPVSNIDDVIALSDQFCVSFEVVIRRLRQESECLRSDYALVLLRSVNGVEEVVASAHDIWLKTVLSEPPKGQAFTSWAKPFFTTGQQTGPDQWERNRIGLRVGQVSRSLSIAEIKQIQP